VLLTGRTHDIALASAYFAGYHLAKVTGAGVALSGAIAPLTRPSQARPEPPPD